MKEKYSDGVRFLMNRDGYDFKDMKLLRLVRYSKQTDRWVLNSKGNRCKQNSNCNPNKPPKVKSFKARVMEKLNR